MNDMTRFLKADGDSFKIELRPRIRTPLTSKPNHSVSSTWTLLKIKDGKENTTLVPGDIVEYIYFLFRAEELSTCIQD